MRSPLAASVCLLVLSLLSLPFDSRPEPASPESGQPSASRMQRDVVFLSSPALNGRQTGTADDLQSARFVADRFRTLGLSVDDAIQSIPVPVSRIEDGATLTLSSASGQVAAQAGPDFLPILDSPTVHLTADVIFVGYGISDPARGFDEYAGVTVRDRVVLFFRGKPDGYPSPVTQADKERTARENGAVGYLTMTGPVPSAYEARRGIVPGPLASYGQAPDGRLPGAWISAEFAARAFQSAGFPSGPALKDLQEALNRLQPRSAPTHLQGALSWSASLTEGRLHNVLAVLPGHDPARSEETIVLGAHRDHFGRQAGLLFPGADDNASGTVILLEVARVLALHPPRRTVVFASFSGEEQGLLGSRLYVGRPARQLKSTVAMINVDHAGVGNGRLMVGLHGLPRDLGTTVAERMGLKEKVDVFGYFPGGDHVPFKEAGMPTAAIVSGGSHAHFHQPGDRAETVQPEILEVAAGYVLALVRELADR